MPYKDEAAQAAAKHRHYLKNKSVVMERQRTKRQRLREGIDAYKLARGCDRCGYDRCAAALEVHHPDPSVKEISVSRAMRANANLEKIVAEMNRCELLCANCHREHHYSENWAAHTRSRA
jgi:hypothetical protein